ncbi:hypothetical protein WAI453_007541 [Rhynchosporium graminicola]
MPVCFLYPSYLTHFNIPRTSAAFIDSTKVNFTLEQLGTDSNSDSSIDICSTPYPVHSLPETKDCFTKRGSLAKGHLKAQQVLTGNSIREKIKKERRKLRWKVVFFGNYPVTVSLRICCCFPSTVGRWGISCTRLAQTALRRLLVPGEISKIAKHRASSFLYICVCISQRRPSDLRLVLVGFRSNSFIVQKHQAVHKARPNPTRVK